MNLVDRVKKILIQPKQEWPVIATEPHTVQDIFTSYVMILAAIPAVAGFIGLSLVGATGFGFTYRVPIGAGIAYMSSTQGTVKLDGVVGFPDPEVSQLDLAIDAVASLSTSTSTSGCGSRAAISSRRRSTVKGCS